MGGAFHFNGQVIAAAHFLVADGDGIPGKSVGPALRQGSSLGKLKVQLPVFFTFNFQQIQQAFEIIHLAKIATNSILWGRFNDFTLPSPYKRALKN
jgi:hypothetical protein